MIEASRDLPWRQKIPLTNNFGKLFFIGHGRTNNLAISPHGNCRYKTILGWKCKQNPNFPTDLTETPPQNIEGRTAKKAKILRNKFQYPLTNLRYSSSQARRLCRWKPFPLSDSTTRESRWRVRIVGQRDQSKLKLYRHTFDQKAYNAVLPRTLAKLPGLPTRHH